MGDILCALSLASSQPLNIAQLVFVKQLCPQTRNLNYCFIFSPEGMLSVSVLRLIKIRICRISSYRISGNNDVITAFFEGYDKAVRPGFGKI